MPKVLPMALANESRAAYMHPDAARKDRELFVYNLGVLLSQTREGIIGAELDDFDIVHVRFADGYVKRVNVRMDSYLAIVRDVTKHL